jgi:3-oxoacyl-(acyl-carrier-protein) synthase
VLERESHARERNAGVYGEILGYGLSNDADPGMTVEPTGKWLERSARDALAEARIEPCDVGVCYGLGRGEPVYDRREIRALQRLFAGRSEPLLGCVNGNLGVAEACSGLFAAAAALLGLRYGEVYPMVGAEACDAQLPWVGRLRCPHAHHHTLVLGGSEYGTNAAVVAGLPAPASGSAGQAPERGGDPRWAPSNPVAP